MPNIQESHIRKIVREVLSESLILEISSEEKSKVMSKSNERIPFSADLMKQAIEQGREVGINFQSNNEKYKMPTVKSRIIHPVAMGYDKKGNLVIRGLHITGQSEKAARETGSRSAEVEAERDGMNAWRLFRVNNLRSMWFTDRFFSDNIPGYNPNDSAMSSQIATYDPTAAKRYQDSLVTGQAQEEPVEEPTQEPDQQNQQNQQEPQTQKKPPVTKDLDQMGYEDQPVQEKRGRSFFK